MILEEEKGLYFYFIATIVFYIFGNLKMFVSICIKQRIFHVMQQNN